MMVPTDFRVASDYSNLTELNKYDGVDIPGALWTKPQPGGDVKDEHGNYIQNEKRFWFIDNGGQVVGMVDGAYVYTLSDGYGIFGDQDETPLVDEGAVGGEILRIAAKDADTGTYNLARFLNGTMATIGYNLTPGKCDIEITDTVIPEPATLALLGVGAGVAAITHIRRKFQGDAFVSTAGKSS